MITPQSGINYAIESSEIFNTKAIGIATVTATRARLEYGGRLDEVNFVLEFVRKKKKEGVDIIIIT